MIGFDSGQVIFAFLPKKPVKLYRMYIFPMIFKLFFKQFYCHYAVSSNLYLQMSISYLFFFINQLFQLFTVFKNSMLMQSLWHSIVRKHCQLVNIGEIAKSFPLKFSTDIRDKNLSSFVKVNLLPFIDGVVLKIRIVLGQYLKQTDCRLIGSNNNAGERPSKFVESDKSHFPQNSGSLISLRNFNSLKDILNELFFSYFHQTFQAYSLMDALLNMTGQVVVLKALKGPEAKIQGIQDKELLQS